MGRERYKSIKPLTLDRDGDWRTRGFAVRSDVDVGGGIHDRAKDRLLTTANLAVDQREE